MDKELFYLIIICTLLVAPRLLQRLRIPAPLTCLVLGVIVAQTIPESNPGVMKFAAVLGITSLFLFAGLEVNFAHMRRHVRALLIFALLRLAALAVMTWIAQRWLGIVWQAAALIALSLLTSSTGFILDSLDQYGIEGDERELVANEAITGELLALGLLFFVLKSTDPQELALATSALIVLIVAIPIIYYALARWILSHAPESEFSLLVMVAIAAGFVTSRLGVENLLGAFIAGVVATQMSRRLTLMNSNDAMHSVKLFSSFFMPFYFFRNGEQIAHEALSATAILIGLLFCLLLPLRWAVVWLRYRFSGDTRGRELRLACSLLPTLIFTLVLGQILRQEFNIGDEIIGALTIYAFVSTLLPSLVLQRVSIAK